QEKLKLKGYPELIEYLDELASSARSAKNLEHYILTLIEHTIRRDFVLKFQQLMQLAKDSRTEVFELREKSFRLFDELFIDKFMKIQHQNRDFPVLVEAVQQRFEQIAM